MHRSTSSQFVVWKIFNNKSTKKSKRFFNIARAYKRDDTTSRAAGHEKFRSRTIIESMSARPSRSCSVESAVVTRRTSRWTDNRNDIPMPPGDMSPLLPGDVAINNVKLIKEIELRPCLYNKSVKEYSNLMLKKKMWDEVCMNVLIKHYSKWNKVQKHRAGKCRNAYVFIHVAVECFRIYT